MAEAAVEERPVQKFYCHMCNVQFENASANFTCPHCSDGFIEELQETAENNDEVVDVDEWEDDEMDFHDMLMASLPVAGERRTSRNNRAPRRFAVIPRARIGRPRALTRPNLRQANVPFENLIEDFIINLGVWGPTGNMQVLLGNPRDYAWGREGLDAIVTQLLNQMDSTGPPPLAKDIIDALPIVEVLLEQVETKLQCSVCWEDFVLKESVRQLPCLHIYHEPCIRPWLELHGTCPICRQNLGNNEQSNVESSSQETGGASGTGPLHTLRSLFQPASQSRLHASSSSTSLDNDTDSANTPRSHSNSDSMM